MKIPDYSIIIFDQFIMQPKTFDYIQKLVEGIASLGAEEDGFRNLWIFQQGFDCTSKAFMEVLEECAMNRKCKLDNKLAKESDITPCVVNYNCVQRIIFLYIKQRNYIRTFHLHAWKFNNYSVYLTIAHQSTHCSIKLFSFSSQFWIGSE